jgi:hypothetical protein
LSLDVTVYQQSTAYCWRVGATLTHDKFTSAHVPALARLAALMV